jgi:hypothetical protein
LPLNSCEISGSARGVRLDLTQFDQDLVGGSITERVAKDVVNACQFMTHDRKGRFEMGDANQIAVEHRIQNRIQKGKPGGMRFGAGSEHTKHSGTIGGEGWIFFAHFVRAARSKRIAPRRVSAKAAAKVIPSSRNRSGSV